MSGSDAATRDLPVLGLNAAVLKVVQLGALSPGRYKTGWVLPIQGPSDAGALRRALDALVARHEALRATIDPKAESPCERVHAMGTSAMDVVDLRRTRRTIELAVDYADAFLRQPVVGSSLPTLWCRAIRLGEDEWLLALRCPNWFVDGWSTFVMSAELRAALEESVAPKLLERRAAAAYSETLTDDSSAPLREVVARTEALCAQDVRRTNGLTRHQPLTTRVRTWLVWKALVSSVNPIAARLLDVIGPPLMLVRSAVDEIGGRRARRGGQRVRPAPSNRDGRSSVRCTIGELPPGTAPILREHAARHRCTVTSVFLAAMLKTISATMRQQDAYVLNVLGRRSPRTFGTVGNLADADFVELDRSLARSDLETIARDVTKQVMTARGIARSGGRIAGTTITDEQRAMIRAGFNRLFHPWELFVVVETNPGVAMDLPMAGITLAEWAEARTEQASSCAADDQGRRRTDWSRADVQVSTPRGAGAVHFELLPLVPQLMHVSFDVTEDEGVRAVLHYDSSRFRDDGIATLLRDCLGRLATTCRAPAADPDAAHS